MLLNAKLQSKPCYDLSKTTNFSHQIVDYCFAAKLLSSPREKFLALIVYEFAVYLILAGKSHQNTFNG